MYDVEEFKNLTAHAALTKIKHRTDLTASQTAGVGALLAHLDGIWDAFALLAERIDRPAD